MIRIVNATSCQVLHRRTTHEIMLNVIEGIKESQAVLMLDVILASNDFTLDTLAHDFFPEDYPNQKLTLLVLLSADYSYYDGRYNRRKTVSETGVEAYDKIKTVISTYLSELSNL